VPTTPSSGKAATEPRIRIERLLDEADRRAALYDETFWSLRRRPKEIPPVWLYDERGSHLFEQITRLPEYYPTAREQEILTAHASEVATWTEARTLVELGAGTSAKTRTLLDALHANGTLERFVPLDASEEVLRESARTIAEHYPIAVHAIVGDFERHLGALPRGENRLIAFLGSTIGNLHPDRRARLLTGIAATLEASDSFLLGVDLVKDPARIEAAYDDSQGVTESFVRNGLDAVNRELRADLNQELLAFEARWDALEEWMDIGFIARETQQVSFAELDTVVQLEQGEKLRLEVSTKFRREGIERELAGAGMELVAWWEDDASEFALLLATRGR
jgi:L-histidine Nalpha-methyltransferase